MEATPVNVEIPNQEEKKVWDEKAINEFMEEQKKALKTCTHVWIGVLAYLLIIGIVACFIVYGILMLGMFVVNLIFFLISVIDDIWTIMTIKVKVHHLTVYSFRLNLSIVGTAFSQLQSLGSPKRHLLISRACSFPLRLFISKTMPV